MVSLSRKILCLKTDRGGFVAILMLSDSRLWSSITGLMQMMSYYWSQCKSEAKKQFAPPANG